MPFEIVRNDIVNMQVDAIVNTTNPQPEIGYGVDTGIHKKAGPKLLAARKRLGTIPVGSAAVTPAYDLDARYVIHTVCPVWRGGNHGEAELLRQCYDRSLELARRKWCRSVAFPLMSAGNHGFPKDLALEIAMNAISSFLLKHEMQIYLVVFSRDAWQISGKLFKGVTSFIDECYVQQKNLIQYGVADKCSVRQEQQQRTLDFQQNNRWREAMLRQLELEEQLEKEADRALAEYQPMPEEDICSPFEPRELVLEEQSEEDLFAGKYESRRRSAPESVYPGCAGPETLSPWEEEQQEVQKSFKSEAPSPICSKAARTPAIFDGAPSPSMKKSAATLATPKLAPKNLEDMLKEADAGFTETLFRMIDKTGKKDSEIYKKANIDRKHFSKIRKNPSYQPSKPTAVAFAIALELDLEETREFISHAGFALSRSSTFDIIIEYFISNRNYNIHEINMTLFEFDQSLLGA